MEGVRFFVMFPFYADLLTSPDLLLDAILPAWSTCKFAEGYAGGKESVIL